MISPRYLIPVIILTILALIPTVIHSYIGATTKDGKSVNNIATTLGNFSSLPSKRNALWGKDMFNTENWFERDYQNNPHHKVRLFAARSYDHKRLYHHPELALSYGQSLTVKNIINLPGSENTPIHILSTNNNAVLVAYALLYNDEFIKNPIQHQLGDSIRLLFSARKPMTLLYASQSGVAPNIRVEQSAVVSLLSLAIQSFKSQAKTLDENSY